MQLMYKLSLITMFCLSTQSYAMQQQIQPTLSAELKQYVLNYRIQKFCPTAVNNNPQAVTRRTQQPPTIFQKLKEFNDVAQKEGEIRSMNEDPRAVLQATITDLIRAGDVPTLFDVLSLYNPSATEKLTLYARAEGIRAGLEQKRNTLPEIDPTQKLRSGYSKMALQFGALLMIPPPGCFAVAIPAALSAWKDLYESKYPTRAIDNLNQNIEGVDTVVTYLDILKPNEERQAHLEVPQAIMTHIEQGDVRNLKLSYNQCNATKKQQIHRHINELLNEAYSLYEEYYATTDLAELAGTALDAYLDYASLEPIGTAKNYFNKEILKSATGLAARKALASESLETNFVRVAHVCAKESNVIEAAKVLEELQKIKFSITPEDQELFETTKKIVTKARKTAQEEREKQEVSTREMQGKIATKLRLKKELAVKMKRVAELKELAEYRAQKQKSKERREFWWNCLKALPEHPGIL